MHGSLDVMVGRSPGLAVALVAAHGSTIAIIWSFALPVTLHLGLKLAVLASLLWSLHQTGWLVAKRHPFRLHFLSRGRSGEADRLEVGFPSGQVLQCTVVEGSLVLSQLVILRFRVDGARWWRPNQSWLLLPDAMPSDDHRRLRVRLRWGRAAPV